MNTTAINTAVLLVKAAVCRVLGVPHARSTLQITTPSSSTATITIALARDAAPSEAEVTSIRTVVEEAIKADMKCFHFAMDRAEAEGLYGDNIYDQFSVRISK